MALAYEFSIGSVRAREKHFLSSSDLEQMLVMDEASLIAFLKDKGYGEGASVEEILEDHTAKMWKYIRTVAPDFDVFLPFFLQNDIHNLKTILKGVLNEKDYRALLLSPCTIDYKTMVKAVEEKRFFLLPPWLEKAAQEAYKMLAQTKDARFSDAFIDRAVMEQMLMEGKRTDSSLLREYLNALVFYTNVKIALRASAAKASRNYMETALCTCDGFEKSTVIAKAMADEKGLRKYLEKLSAFDCFRAMACYERSPSEFEKFVDNYLLLQAKRFGRYSSEGADPLFGYYIGCEYEKKALLIIASGVRTRISPEIIRERLRETYG